MNPTRIIAAVLSKKQSDLAALLARTPALATARFGEDILVEDIPHWLYVGDTPLHLAAAALRMRAAKALIASGADIDAVNRRGACPLHYACDPRPSGKTSWSGQDQEAMIALLLAHGANAEAQDMAGIRPLHRAVRARSPGAVRVLLDAGCNPRASAGKTRSTPLHLAVSSTGAGGTAGRMDLQTEIIQLLIRCGASLNDRDGQGEAVIGRIRGAALRQALSNLGLLP